MRKLQSLLLLLPLSIVLLTGFSGCTKEYYTTEEYVGSEVITRTYDIKENQWEWNSIYNRYECIVSAPEINYDLYEYGTVIGTVFVAEEGSDGSTYEVQKTLPFVQSYNDIGKTYTETISFDIFYGNPSSVTFYIQASDISFDAPAPVNYTFKVAYVSDSGK